MERGENIPLYRRYAPTFNIMHRNRHMTVGVSSESVVVTDYQHFAPEEPFLKESLCNCMILFVITYRLFSGAKFWKRA